MKKLLAIAATLAASSAFAGVKLEVRSDYMNTQNYDSNKSGVENSGTSLFAPSVARLYLNGNVGEAVVESAWNLRSFAPEMATNPYTATSTLYKNMTVDQFVDHLWAGKAMGNWMFKAGKLEVNTGGFERQKSLHGDTYLVSMANSGTGGTLQLASGQLPTVGYITNPENSSGISAAYSITPEHKLEAQITNQTNSQNASGTVSAPGTFTEKSLDRRHTMGMNYLGSFLDKMIVLNLNYTSGAGDTNKAGHEQEFTAVSLRVAPMADLTFDIEYFGNKDKVSTAGATTSYELKTNSTIIEGRYNINGWVPVVKYEMSENKSDVPAASSTYPGVGDFKRDAWTVGVEYVPKADEAFRYHLAYTSTKDKDFGSSALLGGNEDMTKNMIVVGFKYMGDMAK